MGGGGGGGGAHFPVSQNRALVENKSGPTYPCPLSWCHTVNENTQLCLCVTVYCSITTTCTRVASLNKTNYIHTLRNR